MSKMGNLVMSIQEMANTGLNAQEVAVALKAPVSFVVDVWDDMDEYDDSEWPEPDPDF